MRGVNCPVCLEQVTPEFVKQHDEYKMWRCPECDVVYSDPFRNPGPQWYIENALLYIEMPLSWQHRIFLTQDDSCVGKSLLDIGCGNGLFLSYAKRKGYHVCGIDYNVAAINEGKKLFGLGDAELMCTALELYAGNGRKFDIITMFETLEHLDDPNGAMTNIKKLLKPGGILALSVPNPNRFLDTLGEWDCPPMHLTKWSPRSLTKFVESHGFEVLVHKIKLVNGWEVAMVLETWATGKVKQILRKKIVEGIRQNQRAGKLDLRPLLWKLIVIQLNVVQILCYPLAIFLRVLGKEGSQQYLLAKLRM